MSADWGAARTEERAVRWVVDAVPADDDDTRKLSQVPDDELVERTGLPLDVVQRARARAPHYYRYSLGKQNE